MKKSWLAGLMATALIVSMLAGCSSGASTTKETKDTAASTETTAESKSETTAAADDSDTILIGVSASITGSAPTNGRVLSRELSWLSMRLMRPAVFWENSWNFM